MSVTVSITQINPIVCSFKQDLLLRPTFIQKVEESLLQIAKLFIGITTIIDAPVIRDDKLYNMSCILHDRKTVYEYAKQHLYISLSLESDLVRCQN